MKNGIAFAEDLPGLLVENPDGPLNIRNKFTIVVDPDLQPSQKSDVLSEAGLQYMDKRGKEFQNGFKTFDKHYIGPSSKQKSTTISLPLSPPTLIPSMASIAASRTTSILAPKTSVDTTTSSSTTIESRPNVTSPPPAPQITKKSKATKAFSPVIVPRILQSEPNKSSQTKF